MSYSTVQAVASSTKNVEDDLPWKDSTLLKARVACSSRDGSSSGAPGLAVGGAVAVGGAGIGVSAGGSGLLLLHAAMERRSAPQRSQTQARRNCWTETIRNLTAGLCMPFGPTVATPVMLFAQSIAERSRQTDIERTVVGEKARHFLEQGMLELVDQRTTQSGPKSHVYPEPVAAYILYLKQIYPPIHDRESVRIIKRKFGYQTNHHTVKHFLDTPPVPVQLEMDLDIPPFHQFEDAYQARYTVVSLYYAGWNKKSIAGLLQLSRRHVGRIIAAFKRDGFAGLEDQRTRPPNHPANQLTLTLLKEILDIQHQQLPRRTLPQVEPLPLLRLVL